MRLRTLLAATAGLLALTGTAYAVSPVPDCHGLLLDDADNDQYILTPTTGLVARPSIALDIDDVFLTGSSGAEKVNLRVNDLNSSPSIQYSFRWDDPVNFGYSWELTANFANTSGPGTYSLWHLDPSGSWISVVNTTGQSFTGPQGVVQWDKPAGITWPATFTGVAVRAEQYESPLLTDVAIRVDTASQLSWTQPC